MRCSTIARNPASEGAGGVKRKGSARMAGCEETRWQIRVVRAAPGVLPRGRLVLAVIDEQAREIVYMVDTAVPEREWMRAMGDCMTENVQEWFYAGDVLRLPELSA